MPRTIRDVQRKKIVAAEQKAWWSPYNQKVGYEGIDKIIRDVCVGHDHPVLRLDPTDDVGDLTSYGDRLLVPGWATRPLLVLHHLAHALVPKEFPAHGAEFAEKYLELVERHANPQLASALRGEFLEHGVHCDAEHRIFRCRRVIINAVNQRPGVLAEIVCDDPPAQIIGPLTAYDPDKDAVEIQDRAVLMARVRYVFLLK